MKDFISIGQVCIILGLSLSTIYRRLKAGILQEDFRTTGGHRRFDVEKIKELVRVKRSDVIVTYSRVSSSDQKDDLVRQANRLIEFCEKKYPNTKIIDIRDLGSGLNFKKKGLNLLIKLIINKSITKLVINHKDRLLRFGSEIIFRLCKYYDIEVEILEEVNKTFEEELTQDVIELMTVFCAKLYGRRSHKAAIKLQ